MLEILNQIVIIPWKKIKPNMSIFIPCLDRKRHKKTLVVEAERLGYKVVCKEVIEEGKYGLRLWRVE